MNNTNKQAVINAIWDDPGRAFGGQWKQGRNRWDYLTGGEWDGRGAVALLLSNTGENITVIFNHNSGRAGETADVFDYFRDAWNLSGFADTLRALGDRYGLNLTLNDEQRAEIKRAELARDVAASLIEALRLHPDGATARYITQTRGLALDGLSFGELTPESLKAAKESLQARGKAYNAADFEALGLTEQRARAGYNLALPYYYNGALQGFILRDITGKATPKYLVPKEWKRTPYCGKLEHGAPAVFVEGQLDAIRLTQQGVKNAIGIGGAKVGADIGRLLKARAITDVVYIPDRETDTRQHRVNKLTIDAIRAFCAVEVEGEPVINSLLVLDLPTPDDWTKYPKFDQNGAIKGYKIDADTYGKEHPGDLAPMVELEPVEAWRWEFDRLREQAAETEQETNRRPVGAVQEQAAEIYNRYRSPFVREQIRQYTAAADDLAAYGVTPQALADLDEWNKTREYQNKVKAAAADLNKAVQDQANPEIVGAIIRRLADTQGTNTREDWQKVFAADFEAGLDEMRKQPDTLKTKWELGTVDKLGTPHKFAPVEFYPADIALFCAATSHGKTAVLFNAAFDLLTSTNKTYLYISCEENNRQLLQRALNIWLDIPTTENGRTKTGQYCFIRGTRRRAILAAIQGKPAPIAYNPTLGYSEHFDALQKQINAKIEDYGRRVFPRLKFIHTEAAAESICGNILYFVDQFRQRGVQVGGVFVDYMQLLTTDARNYSRHDELKDICKALKDCAARTELPFIVAAQLNREVLRQNNNAGGIDNITVANIGEGADIERIAHDIYLVWQTDRTPLQWYYKAAKNDAPAGALDPYKIAGGIRSRRLFTNTLKEDDTELKAGYLYVEQLKARDGLPGGWGLLPFDGENGTVGATDWEIMKA